ncbi:MAG: hypothetical protein EOM50_10250 [Erysipelotrichia bacterium]|nr:hypothetical protein [Erysipelotrichia bacterium]NCC55069.1 hypothetical protein [Erysipelotrichia bacterium]
MKCYPIKTTFVSVFKGNEEVLEDLIKRNSFQLKAICEQICYEDFYTRCIRFYNEEDYILDEKTIIYTHPITKQKSYCYLYDNCFCLSSLMGFEYFLHRYYQMYFIFDEKSGYTHWLSYENH